MRDEYLAIADAGFILQIDDPWLTGYYAGEPHPVGPETHIEILNHALRGIPAERIRYHTCYGINEGPRVHDVPLAGHRRPDAAHQRRRLFVRSGECAPSARVARLGNDAAAGRQAADPGHDHPRLQHRRTPASSIADLLVTYANLVGRENVIAGADCGFSSQATFTPEVHPTVVWAKFRALAEGAALASQRLWRK